MILSSLRSVSFAILATACFCAGANAAPKDSIVKVDDAKVFAEYTDSYPLVLNYFTHQSEDELINFYQKHYGEVLKQERKRGRLTLNFEKNKQKIRVILSNEKQWQQVDIMINKAK